MVPLFAASFITLICLIVSICRDDKRSVIQYIILFLTCVAVCYGLHSFLCEAGTHPITEQMIKVCGKKQDTPAITFHAHKPNACEIKQNFIWQCQDKINYHFEEGMKCFREAEEACLWFPAIEDRDKAQMCFLNIIAAANPGTPKTRLISAIIAAVGQYGCAVISEWQRIDTKLHQARTHFELEQFYLEVGRYVEKELQYLIEKANKEKHGK